MEGEDTHDSVGNAYDVRNFILFEAELYYTLMPTPLSGQFPV